MKKHPVYDLYNLCIGDFPNSPYILREYLLGRKIYAFDLNNNISMSIYGIKIRIINK